MTDDLERLRSTLSELKKELDSLGPINDETRQSLEEVVQDIHSSLHASAGTDIEQQSLIERLKEAAQGFEGSHPTLAGIIARMIDGLGQIGI
jgi:hypothetical protein